MNKSEFEGLDDDTRAQVLSNMMIIWLSCSPALQYEGYRAGVYIRIVIEGMPAEFIQYFDPHYPVILGGLLSNEETLGFVQVTLSLFVVSHTQSMNHVP